MKDLVEAIAKALVDHSDQVSVRAVDGEQVTVLELKVHPEDFGKSDRAAGAHCEIDTNDPGRSGDEAQEKIHAGNT